MKVNLYVQVHPFIENENELRYCAFVFLKFYQVVSYIEA